MSMPSGPGDSPAPSAVASIAPARATACSMRLAIRTSRAILSRLPATSTPAWCSTRAPSAATSPGLFSIDAPPLTPMSEYHSTTWIPWAAAHRSMASRCASGPNACSSVETRRYPTARFGISDPLLPRHLPRLELKERVQTLQTIHAFPSRGRLDLVNILDGHDAGFARQHTWPEATHTSVGTPKKVLLGDVDVLGVGTFDITGRAGESIRVHATETLLAYSPVERDAFYAGEWSRLLPGREARQPRRCEKQVPRQRCHFAEIFNLPRTLVGRLRRLLLRAPIVVLTGSEECALTIPPRH